MINILLVIFVLMSYLRITELLDKIDELQKELNDDKKL
jgi:hypothetical protein